MRDLDPLHAGIVVDSYHLFVRGETSAALDVIPPERIFLVQFADVAGPIAPAEYKKVARHARLLPGDGRLPLDDLIMRLQQIGYDGPIGLEVFNDGSKAQAAGKVARRAFASLQRLMRTAMPSTDEPRTSEVESARDGQEEGEA